jgi:hypothetical protein
MEEGFWNFSSCGEAELPPSNNPIRPLTSGTIPSPPSKNVVSADSIVLPVPPVLCPVSALPSVLVPTGVAA